MLMCIIRNLLTCELNERCSGQMILCTYFIARSNYCYFRSIFEVCFSNFLQNIRQLLSVNEQLLIIIILFLSVLYMDS